MRKEQFKNKEDWKHYDQHKVKDGFNDNKKVVKGRPRAIQNRVKETLQNTKTKDKIIENERKMRSFKF